MRRKEEALVQAQDGVERLHKLQVSKVDGKKSLKSISTSDSEHTNHWLRNKELPICTDSFDHKNPTSCKKWKVPKQRGVKELHCADRIFNPVISYRRYRLRMNDQVINEQIAASYGLKRRRLDHFLKDLRFSGACTLSILSFLRVQDPVRCKSHHRRRWTPSSSKLPQKGSVRSLHVPPGHGRCIRRRLLHMSQSREIITANECSRALHRKIRWIFRKNRPKGRWDGVDLSEEVARVQQTLWLGVILTRTYSSLQTGVKKGDETATY